jgi:ubiquinone/menaquinone biosynthesis C-methylase UbiE
LGNDPYTYGARFYDRLIEPFLSSIRRKTIRLIAEQAHRRPSFRILEVACGTGSQALRIAEAGFCPTVVDKSLSMLLQAARKRRTLRGGDFFPVRADATALPFATGAFDAVVVQLGLHEMDGPVRAGAMREIIRVAAGGACVLAVDFLPSPGFTAANLALTAVEFAAGPTHFQNGRVFLRDGGIEALLTGFGLDISGTVKFFGGTIGLVSAKKP